MSYVVGRPKEYDRIQVAQALVDWASKKDSLNLNKFCAEQGIPPQKLSLWAQENEHFREAYNYAKAFIGARREEKLSTNELHVKAYDLNASTYDFFLKEEKRLQAEFESKLKSKENESLGENLKGIMDKVAKGEISQK
jgi:hypothetical protein